jgi:hypothetical protein
MATRRCPSTAAAIEVHPNLSPSFHRLRHPGARRQPTGRRSSLGARDPSPYLHRCRRRCPTQPLAILHRLRRPGAPREVAATAEDHADLTPSLHSRRCRRKSCKPRTDSGLDPRDKGRCFESLRNGEDWGRIGRCTIPRGFN